MISRASSISVKLALDCMYLFCSINSFFWGIFKYDNDFTIEILKIQYEYHVNGLVAYINPSYSDFDKYLCTSTNLSTLEVCEKLTNFRIAGECYIVISGLSSIFALYCIINLLGKLCNFASKGCQVLDFTNYVYPLLNTLSLGLFLIVSEIISLSSIDVDIGIFLMFLAELISILSFCFFCGHKQNINELGMIYNTEEDKKSEFESEKNTKKSFKSESSQELECDHSIITEKPEVKN